MIYGEIIPDLKINGKKVNYPVLNERDARAGAGIMFLIAISTFFYTLFTKKSDLLSIVVIAFTIEFLLRVINPYIAPIFSLGKFFVRQQKAEYSGAVQKRFAWTLGLIMAVSMIFISIIFQIKGILPFTICAICLALLWLETSLGVCVGCKMYYGLMKKGLVKQPEVMPACPGGVCPVSRK